MSVKIDRKIVMYIHRVRAGGGKKPVREKKKKQKRKLEYVEMEKKRSLQLAGAADAIQQFITKS